MKKRYCSALLGALHHFRGFSGGLVADIFLRQEWAMPDCLAGACERAEVAIAAQWRQ
jgi:hypothetical protein